MKKKTIITLISLFLACFMLNNLFAPPKNVSVKITSNPSGAKIIRENISGDPLITPVVSQFTVGSTYTMTFSMPGYKSKTIDYYCDGSPINVTLEPENFIKITLPYGAKLYINDREQNLHWGGGHGRNKHGHGHQKWKTFTFYGRPRNKIRIIYYDLIIERNIRFDGKTLSLVGNLR